MARRKGLCFAVVERRSDKFTWNLVAFKILLVTDMKKSCMGIVLLSSFCFFYTLVLDQNISYQYSSYFANISSSSRIYLILPAWGKVLLIILTLTNICVLSVYVCVCVCVRGWGVGRASVILTSTLFKGQLCM